MFGPNLSRTLRALSVLLIFAVSAYAEVPKVISYQGRLTDADGNPVPDGNYDLTFQIVEHDPPPLGETPLWSSGLQTVTVSDGLFVYYLGSNVPLPAEIFNDDGLDSYFLRIKVPESLVFLSGSELVTVPFSVRSIYSDTAAYALAGAGSGGSNGWVDDGAVVHTETSSDRVGIGTSSAGEQLVVGKDLGSFGGSFIVSGSPFLDDVCGFKLGYSADNHTTLEWSGDGPSFALHTQRSGNTHNNVIAVNGRNVGIGQAYASEPLVVGDDLGSFNGDRIVIGDNTSGAQTGLVIGEDNNNRSYMLWDIDDNALRFGTRDGGAAYNNMLVMKEGRVGIGTSIPSQSKLDVYNSVPYDTSGSYPTITSLRAIAERTLDQYTYHQEIALNAEATQCENCEGEAIGAIIKARGGHIATGIKVDVYDAYDCEGIHVSVPSGHRAAYFSDDVDIAGNLSKLSGSFKIDHPLDPENKYLQHSFVESPDMMNIYNGNVILDNNGEAVVEMPDWFDSLNRDFRYQLTCIGGFEPVYVSKEMENGKFSIAGGSPGLKVSWQVTGIRQDRWANEHRIEVEVDKSEDEKGHYITPELYGYGEEKSID